MLWERLLDVPDIIASARLFRLKAPLGGTTYFPQIIRCASLLAFHRRARLASHKQMTMRFLRTLAMLLAVSLSGCVSIPSTSEESFRLSRLVGQPDGRVMVIGPEIQFTVRQAHGYSGFQALVSGRNVSYFQKTSLAGLGDKGTFEVTRAQMEHYRASGTSVRIIDTSIKIEFTPAYIDGFLRRVDSVAGVRGGISGK
jgi:hypothetical protein